MEAGLKAEAKDQTDAQRLEAEFQKCLTRPQSFYNLAQLNRDTRYNYWQGKSWDGRKWTPAPNDSEVLPWRGASDLPVPMVDGYINEDVALSVMALMNGNITASGHSVNDAGYAQRCTNVIKWMLNDEMTERGRETELLGNFHFERGKAILGVFWDRQVQMGYEELTLAMINGMAQQAQQMLQQNQTSNIQHSTPNVQPPQPPAGPPEGGTPNPKPLTTEQMTRLTELASVPLMLPDPEYEDKLVELLQEYAQDIVEANFAKELGDYGDELLEDYKLEAKTARRLVIELREEGKTKLPVPQVKRNRPAFTALALDEDFYMPQDATDLENARALFWREWVTEEQIRERVVSNNWDPAWCEFIIQKGKGSVGPNAMPAGAASGSYTGSAQAHGRTLLDTQELYGLLHCYEKKCNDDGVPGIWYTVIHPGFTALSKNGAHTEPKDGKKSMKVTQDHAVRLLLDYAHGEYPFILFRREFLSRRMDDSRGYGEIGYTWQKQIKNEFDGQIDRASISTIPPLHHPKGRPPSKWGPGCKVPGSKADYQFAEIPQYDPGSEQVVKMVQGMADWYFGRQTEGRDPALANIMRQHLIAIWLDGWRQAITQMFQLMQQFMPDDFYYRVVGSSQGKPIHATREEIQGKFSVSVKFDTDRLDSKTMKDKSSTVVELVGALDNNGIVDHSKLLAMLLAWVDADVAEQILQPVEAATQKEADDEQNVFAKMWAGIGVDVKPGQAYQLRLQVLQQALAGKDPKTGEPANMAAMQRYQSDPQFKQRVDNRMQQLQFQVEQRQNAVIGRLGAAPAPGPSA